MDLISAIAVAKKLSAKFSRTMHYVVESEDGECEVFVTPYKGVLAAYSNGKEIPYKGANAATPNSAAKVKSVPVNRSNQNSNFMSEEKSETASTTPKKVAAKKPAVKPAKKAESKKANLVPVGVTMMFTPEQEKRYRAKLEKSGKGGREFVTEVVVKAL